MKKILTTLIAVFAMLSIFNTVKADYPEKPITMVIPFGPGGSHDLNARVFTSIIPQYLGNAIIVKLVPGFPFKILLKSLVDLPLTELPSTFKITSPAFKPAL